MAKKNIITKTLMDPAHWVGWILTTISLFIVFYLLPSSVMNSYWLIMLITLFVIIKVDVIKHYIGLQ